VGAGDFFGRTKMATPQATCNGIAERNNVTRNCHKRPFNFSHCRGQPFLLYYVQTQKGFFIMRSIGIVFVCVGMCIGRASAQTPPEAGDDLNDLMALRAKVMLEAHQMQVEIRQTWNDPA
jgi:hypothetical protein